MSPRTRKILFGVMFIWFIGLYLLWVWTGEAPERPVEPALREALAPPPPPAPATPPPPEEAPAPPADPLAGYLPCQGTGAGRGSFGRLSGSYDDIGRFVLFIDFDGRTGGISGRESLRRPSKNVAYLDFEGDIPFSQEYLRPRGGALELVRLGRHRGFTRVSLNFSALRSPSEVRVEILCKQGSVAIRAAWGDALAAPVLTAPPAAAAGDGAAGGNGAAGAGTTEAGGAPSAAGDGAANGDGAAGAGTTEAGGTPSAAPGLQPALPPVPPVPGPLREMPGPLPADGSEEDGSGDGASGTTVAPGAGPPAPDAAAPAVPVGLPVTNEEPGPCRGTGEGRGSFGEPQVSWDADRKVLTAVLPLVSEEGPGDVTAGHSLGRRGAVTWLDFKGDFRFGRTGAVPPGGPVRLLRFGRHPGLARLGFNYRDGEAPDRPPEVGIRCLPNAVEVSLDFAGGPEAGAPPAPAAAGQAPAVPVVGGDGKPCAASGEGRGVFGAPRVEFRAPDAVAVSLPIAGGPGPGGVTSGDSLGRERGNVSFLDFAGRFTFGNATAAVNMGPLGLLRFGAHPGFTRLSLNWLDGKAPESAEAELLCGSGGVEAVFRLKGGSALASFPADAIRPPAPQAAPAPAPAPAGSPAEAPFPDSEDDPFRRPPPPAMSSAPVPPAAAGGGGAAAEPLLPGEADPLAASGALPPDG
ncbi:MAG: hypothetical protein LBG06_03170, partial [Deltaproteobacteria bacterium]|nr:hypothetical protein [Deltaproteobacteria bacterium]